MLYLDYFLKSNILYFIYKPHFICLFLILILTTKKNQKTLISILIIILCFSSGAAINLILKILLKFPLPETTPYNWSDKAWEIKRTTTYAMPSGHISFICCLFTSLDIQIKKIYSQKLHKIFRIVFLSLGISSCFRIYYLGYHHLLDIAVATLIFIPYSILICKFGEKSEKTSKYYQFLLLL